MAGRRNLSPNLSATCPMLCVKTSKGWQALTIQQLRFHVVCEICASFVSVDFTCWYDTRLGSGEVALFVPKRHDTTFTHVTVDLPSRPNAVFATALVPRSDVQKHGWSAPKEQTMSVVDGEDPELFSIVVNCVTPGDQIRVQLTYFEPMILDASNGTYHCSIPTVLPPGVVQGPDLPSLNMTIYSGTEHAVQAHHDWCAMYPVQHNMEPGQCQWMSSPGTFSNVEDAVISYTVWSPQIAASLLLLQPDATTKAAVQQPDGTGTFALFVAPPDPQYVPPYSRSVIFVIDRSGSMTGEPIRFAQDALFAGLDTLAPHEEFAVVAFDDQQEWFSCNLKPASAFEINACKSWVRSITARGLTDIMTPLTQCLKLLSSSANNYSCIFLLTDGAVSNEREICRMIETTQYQQQFTPRISTLGVGQYCNHFFLKQLAAVGRGSSDVAFQACSIRQQMEALLLGSSKPVLSDITLSIPGVTYVETYPYPIPDLCAGRPVCVSGKFTGVFPSRIALNGRLSDGRVWSQDVTTKTTDRLPLHALYVKNLLDLLTAKKWLEKSDNIQEIVDLSIQSGVPSHYTQMVGFETTKPQYEKYKQQIQKGVRPNFLALGAVGVVVAAGAAAALTFGDVGATLANALISGAVGLPDPEMCAGCCEICFGALPCDGCDGCDMCDENCIDGCLDCVEAVMVCDF